jgi:hypothetical protein
VQRLATRSHRRMGTGIATCLRPAAPTISAAEKSGECMTNGVGTALYAAPAIITLVHRAFS